MQRKKTIKILNFRPSQKKSLFASEASNISIFAINLGYLVFIFGAKIQIFVKNWNIIFPQAERGRPKANRAKRL